MPKIDYPMDSRQAITSVSFPVAPSKMFTYPTRLADSWKPAIQEICLPPYEVTRPEIVITAGVGSTRQLGIKNARSIKGRLRSQLKRLMPPIEMHDEYIFDSRYEIDSNIAHVVDNVVSAVLAARNVYSRIAVVLGAGASTMATNAFKILGIPTICTNCEVLGKLVVVQQAGRARFSGDGLCAAFYDDVQFEGYKTDTPERIFISRRNTRRLINENEVERLLEGYGFHKVYFEDYPLSEQWSLARNANAIVAIHGAALSSLLFNRRAAKVVEIFHPGYRTIYYRHMTNAVGGTWCGITGQLPPDIIKHLDYRHEARFYHSANMRIDIVSLSMALKYVRID